jgi:hypothetical protein
MQHAMQVPAVHKTWRWLLLSVYWLTILSMAVAIFAVPIDGVVGFVLSGVLAVLVVVLIWRSL